MNKPYLVILVLTLLFVKTAYLSGGVVVEFLYYDPSEDPRYCPVCPTWIDVYDAFLRKNETMSRIQSDYGSQISVSWMQQNSSDGKEEKQIYNVTQPNSLVIKSDEGNVTIVQGDFNETYIRTVIDIYLQQTPASSPSSPWPFLTVVALAFFCFIIPWAAQRFKKENLLFRR